MEWKQWEGRVIDGRFPLRQYLGCSGHSGVFVTEFGQGTPQNAVIKLVPADSGKAEAWMLRRELAARLSHPGLLSIREFGSCQVDGEGLVYAVMEPIDEDLSQVIPSRPLAPAEAREMLAPVLETLAYIHAEGFVHGALTPSNIMAAGDRVKLSSDGLLRIGESSDDLWAPGENAPPESRAGMTPAGDVWMLGMTLVEVMTQRAPTWDPAGSSDPTVAEQLEEPFLSIARRCLRADPRLRCSLQEISLTLQPAPPGPQAIPSAAEAVPIAPNAKPASPKAARKRQYLLPAIAGVVLGLLIFAGVIRMSSRSVNSPAPAEPQSSAPAEQAAAPEKPETVPVTQPTAEVAAGNGEQASEAPAPAATPEPAPEAVPEAPSPKAEAPARETTSPVAPSPGGDVVDRVVPDVPREILGTIRGSVRVAVRVKVDPSGAVVDAEFDSHPGSKYFGKVALEAARRWRFKPASDAAGATNSARLLRFEFRPDGCEASSGQLQR